MVLEMATPGIDVTTGRKPAASVLPVNWTAGRVSPRNLTRAPHPGHSDDMAAPKPRKLGRKETRDLDVEIGFLEGLVARDPGYIEALQLLGDDYTRRGRVEDGLRVDQRLKGLRPEDPDVHFNLACSLALARDFEAAADALCMAIELGYRDFRWLRRDPDLASFRRHKAYQRVRLRMNSLEKLAS